MAFCPFHDNVNTPAFTMSLTKGIWFCFSCHAKGTLKMFLKAMGIGEGLVQTHYGSLIDALRKNVDPAFDPNKPGVICQEPLDEAILGFFHECPMDLINEGFTEETLLHFGVGFDKKHNRITYPIRDFTGNLVGISGRTVTGAYPKYKVYDLEYKDFGLGVYHTDKSRYLWNSSEVYPQVYFSRGEKVVLVEGFKACMWAWQAGIKNVLALLGSSMSAQQKWVLERLGAPVYLWLDNDDAGRNGTKKIGDDLSKSLDVFVIGYEEAQPSDLALEDVQSKVASATDYHLWAVRKYLKGL